ncbi:hypothetical protein UY416_01195 [Paenibacillus polymyxa]|uniref:hypothetical protein n=1 Tax=Paenibacillus polymyxa TaxID=1406 RepID=UPI002AB5B2EF|nr:hypothetical protein [Paenibacillus polymyxa]MDY8044908.1 hypothetical protein [Paenibacillus polymyxa]
MKDQNAFVILLILNIVYGLTLFAYPAMLMVVAFSFDAPTAGDYLISYIFAYVIMSYPIGVFISWSCWYFYHRYAFKKAYIIANFMLLWPATLVLSSWIQSAFS